MANLKLQKTGAIKNSTAKLDLLAFAPHPDDIEVFCGGLAALSVKQGHQVGIIDMTRGELSSRGDLKTRAKETELATKILGVHVRENLDFQDGAIGLDTRKISREKQLARIVGIIRKYRPSIVLAPYWEERHPDHVRASNLITEALFFCSARKFKSFPDLPAFSGEHNPIPKALYYSFRAVFKPSFITNITPVITEKLLSIAAFESQIGTDQKDYILKLLNRSRASGKSAAAVKQQAEFQTLLSSKLSISTIISKDQFYGGMVGSEYGEGYLSKEALQIDEPLKFLTGTRNPYLY